MAIYHFHVGVVSRKTGRSSVAASAYRAGEKLRNENDGVTHNYSGRSSVEAVAYRAGERLTDEQGTTHDYTNKRGVVHTEIMLPDNAPSTFFDRGTLWNAVEKSEKRCDAQTARDIDIALPVEFSRSEQIT
ncbi:MAG: MobA/MobL family protein, partial [Oscillospiraceae bacterium]|nr:MobA/MobL family protein [Oscillospiraceae bacterium]